MACFNPDSAAHMDPVLAHCSPTVGPFGAAEKGYHHAFIEKREDTIKNCYLLGTSRQMGYA